MQQLKTSPTRSQIRAAFALKRNRGAASRLAEELGVAKMTVSEWLRGKMTSARIAAAAEAKYYELTVKKEDQANAA